MFRCRIKVNVLRGSVDLLAVLPGARELINVSHYWTHCEQCPLCFLDTSLEGFSYLVQFLIVLTNP